MGEYMVCLNFLTIDNQPVVLQLYQSSDVGKAKDDVHRSEFVELGRSPALLPQTSENLSC